MKSIPIWRLEMAYNDLLNKIPAADVALKNDIPLSRVKQLQKQIELSSN